MPIERLRGKGNAPGLEEYYIPARREVIKEISQPLPGERESSPEQRRIAQTIIEIFQQEWDRLGIVAPVDLLPQQFHFLGDTQYRKEFREKNDTVGMYHSRRAQLYVKDRGQSPILQLRLAMHEALHAMSFHAWDIEIEMKEVSNRRVGYRQSAGDDQFRGLNEGMTELIVAHLWDRYRDVIADRMDISAEEVTSFTANFSYRSMYEDETKIIHAISLQVAGNSGKTPEQVFETLERGYFTGEMMHLREVEKAYGEGSLRVLARLGSSTYDDTKGLLTKAIGQYFSPMPDGKRMKFGKRILAWPIKRKA